MDMEEEEELDKFTYILFDPNVYLAELDHLVCIQEGGLIECNSLISLGSISRDDHDCKPEQKIHPSLGSR
ncbi:hypothetical protein SNOG_03969 [Parastagonospora nodorum SN15]|uniref:Uncharacterized protein n=1 Tax=Phaeosphaeria nodorum (strain SN15 / ATCC MYA-4574 / FGSC 10173) TaxID=321614 RepID=Q0UW95_PHANO|nr:hypothetical protein SNOG_03969 [Parastagonospora nodorum SN15]EAT89174.1 hypothetical protein SNOG_03969 [Parastagonospora nodorum SN15]